VHGLLQGSQQAPWSLLNSQFGNSLSCFYTLSLSSSRRPHSHFKKNSPRIESILKEEFLKIHPSNCCGAPFESRPRLKTLKLNIVDLIRTWIIRSFTTAETENTVDLCYEIPFCYVLLFLGSVRYHFEKLLPCALLLFGSINLFFFSFSLVEELSPWVQHPDEWFGVYITHVTHSKSTTHD